MTKEEQRKCIFEVYPEMKGKTKKQRVIDYINGLEMFNGVKIIPESAINVFKFVNPNQRWGGLEDIDPKYIMAVCRQMGCIKCYIGSFGGIVIRFEKYTGL